MLAEKFMLYLETIISSRHADKSPGICTSCRHVPIELGDGGIEANPPAVVLAYCRRDREAETRCIASRSRQK